MVRSFGCGGAVILASASFRSSHVALSSPLVAVGDQDVSVPHIQRHAHEVIRHGEEALSERLWLPALQRLMCFLWRGHASVPDHCHGEADGGGSVHVLAVDVLDVGEAPADAVLDAPAPAAGRPLDGRPRLTSNREAVDARWSGIELHLDDAVSARIRGRLLALSTCFHVVFSWQVVRLRFPDREPCEGGPSKPAGRPGVSAYLVLRGAILGQCAQRHRLRPQNVPDRSLKADQRHGDARRRQSYAYLAGLLSRG